MRKSSSGSRVGIGISSVLMILVVLAMTALSMLACTDARSTYRMTRRNVEVTAAGYTASLEAQRLLAAIDQAVFEQPEEGVEPMEWLMQNTSEQIAWYEQEGRICFSFSIPAVSGQSLQVEGYVKDTTPRAAITCYCLTTEDSDFDTPSLNLMGRS